MARELYVYGERAEDELVGDERSEPGEVPTEQGVASEVIYDRVPPVRRELYVVEAAPEEEPAPAEPEHAIGVENSWCKVDGTWLHMIRCPCGQVFEGTGANAANAATFAHARYQAHLDPLVDAD